MFGKQSVAMLQKTLRYGFIAHANTHHLKLLGKHGCAVKVVPALMFDTFKEIIYMTY